MALTCSSQMIKYLLFLFNLLFVFTGVLLLTIGLAVKGAYHEYDHFLNNKFIYASDLLIVIGCVIFIVAFFGCCGAIKENACMTLTFSSLLVAIFVLELIVGVGGYLLKNKTEQVLTEQLEKTMQQYGTNNETTLLWDNMQEKFHCCGVNSYKDWLNATNTTHGHLPISCCVIPPGTFDTFNCTVHTTTLYTEGCLTEFGDYIRAHSSTVEGVGITLAVVQLLGIIFSCYLSKQIRRDYETV